MHPRVPGALTPAALRGRRRWLSLPVVLIALLLAAACGGSDDGEGSPSPAPSGVNNPPPSQNCERPPAPQGLTVTSSDTRVTMRWSAVSNVIDYHVQIGSVPATPNLVSTNVGATTYQWNGNGVGTFYFRVAARSSCGTGPNSTEVAHTVTSPN